MEFVLTSPALRITMFLGSSKKAGTAQPLFGTFLDGPAAFGGAFAGAKKQPSMCSASVAH